MKLVSSSKRIVLKFSGKNVIFIKFRTLFTYYTLIQNNIDNNRACYFYCLGRHHGQIPRGFALRGAFRSSVGVELEERVRRRRENDPGDQRRVAKEETPYRPPGTDRRPIRSRQRLIHANGPSTILL